MRSFSTHRIVLLLYSVLTCDCVHVTVKDGKKYAMLFSSLVLQCQYDTRSTQTPVVQWWYKSYCTDRTRDSFTFTDTLAVQGPQPGAHTHLDCSDKSRTVRIVASKQGASLTLSEHYKGRDISIINKADLRFGELRWGDSGVYFCKVVSGDDLEGRNEGQVELLVLGKTGVLDDVLPEFELEIMPEWLFVGCVVLGSVLLLVLLGVCWCQCCPHSCCCYLRCCCCPDTCCCPKHLYEAGKAVKNGHPAQIALYPPYYGVPMVTPAVPTLIDPKLSVAPPTVENSMAGERGGDHPQASQAQDPMKGLYFIERNLEKSQRAKWDGHPSVSMSELSSLHDGDLDSRQSYRQLHRKDLLPIGDLNSKPQCHLASKTQRIPPASYQSNRTEEQDGRWTCRTEHLPRRPFDSRGRSSSLDELEEFARNYGPRGGRRGHFRDRSDPRWDFDTEQTRHSPCRFRDDDEGDDWRRRSPPPSPRRRCNTDGSEHYGAGNRPYDDTYLNTVLERKARGRGERGGRGDGDSDTPSKSSKKSSDCYYSRSPTNRPEEDDSLPPYSEVERFRSEEPVERERFRTMEPAMRPFSYTRPNQGVAHTLQEHREDKDRGRKLTTHLSRDSLIV